MPIRASKQIKIILNGFIIYFGVPKDKELLSGLYILRLAMFNVPLAFDIGDVIIFCFVQKTEVKRTEHWRIRK